MKIIEEIKHVQGVIEYLLSHYPEFRDSDNKLIAQVWFLQLMDKNMTAVDFLKHIGYNDLVNPESIRRSRQLLQQRNVLLRGKNWESRHEDSEEFKQQILEL